MGNWWPKGENEKAKEDLQKEKENVMRLQKQADDYKKQADDYKYKTYTLEREDGGNIWRFPFYVCDFRGIGGVGATHYDARKALHGHLANGVYIPSADEREDDGSNPNNMQPSTGDAQLLIIVQDAGSVGQLAKEKKTSLEEITELIKYADNRNIPTVVFLTKCDDLDADIIDNYEQLHRSELIQDAVKTAAGVFKRNENRIFPVKNFTTEINVSPPMATQFLYPLFKILDDLYVQFRNSCPK